ncbi:SiaB family protein kinase [uncultured Pseudodesulfovibrio sp.]|uniref:SiaB family protein kinase n=1 Tax=uncultured Pseudodesulfovibrio sp. TaxID=2035858 RepID=UPI0029C6B00A|nr:SiaB family protein kinase [uncultured Pseudodesulfovibrio sp.]
MADSLFRYYEEMQREGVILYFNGPVSQGVVESIADLMRNKMSAEEAGMGSVQRVFSILVEQMQNIVRYSSEREVASDALQGDMAYGQVVVGREMDGRIFVACGNRVSAEDCGELTDHIERLRRMNPEELKAYYRERRRSRAPENSKGAGLGFVEMARKSARPMDYEIRPLDCDTSFFSMKVVAQ